MSRCDVEFCTGDCLGCQKGRELFKFPEETVEAHRVRKFDTGATRDTDDGKLAYYGFLSPLALRRFAQYMHEHRVQSDGSLRDPDNWQKGIPFDAYMDSGWRHFMDWWLLDRGYDADSDLETALCALLFNVQGYLHEFLAQSDFDADHQGYA